MLRGSERLDEALQQLCSLQLRSQLLTGAKTSVTWVPVQETWEPPKATLAKALAI